MAITLKVNAVRPNADGTSQTVFFTITDDDGKDLRYHADTPILDAAGIVAYFEANKDKLHVQVLREFWPDADIAPFQKDGASELEAFKAWIAAGHKNAAGTDEAGNPAFTVIERRRWRDTHPAWIKLLEDVNAASSLQDVKAVLRKIVKALDR